MISVGVHIQCVYMIPSCLNGILVVDSPYRTLMVIKLLVKFIDYTLPLCTPEMLSSLSKSRLSLFNAHFALLV